MVVNPKLLLIFITLIVTVVNFFSERKKLRPLTNSCVIAYGLIACWSAHLFFAAWPVMHLHEQAIHYLGSKYFKELGYNELYNAIVIADTELNSKLASLEWLLSLSERTIVRKDISYQRSAEIKAKFPEKRWSEFKRDCAYFLEKLGVGAWQDLLLDNGYNAPPFAAAWTGLVTNLSPPTDEFLMRLGYVDKVLFGLAFLCIGFTFGLRAFLLSLIFIFTNPATIPGWIGGSILRYDWFFLSALGFLALKNRWYILSGVALTAAACARLFPAAFIVSVVIKWVTELVKERRIPSGAANYFAAIIITVIFMLTWNSAYGGADKLAEFLKNIRIYNATALTNSVGFRAVVVYRGELSREDLLISSRDSLVRPTGTDQRYIEWRNSKAKIWKDAFTIRCLVGFIFLALFISSARAFTEVEQAALGTVLLYMFLAPNNYYFVFLAFLMAVCAANSCSTAHLLWTSALFLTSTSIYWVSQITPLWITNYFVYSLSLLAWVVFFYSVLFSLSPRIRKLPSAQNL